jgi:hypothetical protein
MSLGESILEDQVLPDNVAVVGEALAQAGPARRIRAFVAEPDIADTRGRQRLCAHHGRPG